MKVFIPAKSTADDDDKKRVDKLCDAVRDAKLEPFCFVRDVQDYKDTYRDKKEMWGRIYDELGACDMLLVEVTNEPSTGQVIELGMAYALHKPVVLVKKHGASHSDTLTGVSSKVIEYKDYADLTKQLAKYDVDRNYNNTDKITLVVMYLLLGGALTWAVSQIWVVLAPIAAIIYWLVVRKMSATVRAFDRIVIYIPLLTIWWAGFAWFYPSDVSLALGWTVGYWLLVVFLLRRLKFSL